jgi:hypothetical protein
MRAAIIEREDMPAVVYEKDRAMVAVHNESPFGFQLFEGARANEIRDLSIHGRLIRQAVRGNGIQQGPSPICQSSFRCTSSADRRERSMAVQDQVEALVSISKSAAGRSRLRFSSADIAGAGP